MEKPTTPAEQATAADAARKEGDKNPKTEQKPAEPPKK